MPRTPAIARLCMLGLLTGCSLWGPRKAELGQITVVAEVAANQNAATELDIVFVYDSHVSGLLPKTGPEWFAHKQALVAGLANGIEVVSLQVPPATLVKPHLPARHGKAIGVWVFANYLSPGGQAAGNITPYAKVTLWLTPTTIVYKQH